MSPLKIKIIAVVAIVLVLAIVASVIVLVFTSKKTTPEATGTATTKPNSGSTEPEVKTSVYAMRTDDLVDPVGIDNKTPVFSWKMQSATLGQKQTAYQIVVKNGDATVWDSGKVEDSRSVGIKYAGETLKSSSEYIWTVTVWDKDGNPVASEASSFEMGLLEANAWSDAKWIGFAENLFTETAYTIDFDFVIERNNQGFCFGMQDTNTYVMWQVNTEEDNNKVLLRPHFRKDGNWTAYPGGPGNVQAVDITEAIGYNSSALTGKTVHERIEVDGKKIKTYFGADAEHLTLANEYTHTEDIPLGKIGFRHNGNEGYEIAKYDNIVVKGSAGDVLYQNDFSSGQIGFTGNETISVVDGMLRVGGAGKSAEWIFIQSEGNGLPAYRKSVTPKADLVSAKLYTSGLGVYESYINGKRVGRRLDSGEVLYDELKPGYTQPGVRVFYNSYDVTWMVKAGEENVLSAVVTSGWWTGAVAASKGKETAYLAKLILTYADGSTEVVNTGTGWKTARASAVQMGDIFNGETYDARADQSWMLPGYNDSAWGAVKINTEFRGEIVAWSGSTITVHEDLERSAKEISVYQGTTGAKAGAYGKVKVIRTYKDGDSIELKPGETLLVDFGQNFAGWEAFTVTGKAGTTLTVKHGEILNDGDGLTSRGCDGPGGSIYNANYRSAQATTRYILRGGDAESYHPSFTYYGFRYIEITTDQTVTFTKISGQVVSSVEEETGTLETSNADVNQLISNIRWGQYSNYLSVPTDCPQRDERQGWAADTQNFAEAGCYFGFSKSFLMKFAEDMRDAQHPNGNYATTAPRTRFDEPGTIGWADAGVIVPYFVYAMYGDTTVIVENWESMEKFMDYLTTTNHWSTGTLHGDWLAYESNDEELKRILGVSYYAWDALLMSQMAEAIGKTDDVAKYMAVYENEKAYYQKRYVKEDGTLVRGEQSVCLYALFLDLLPDDASFDAVTNQLISNIERNGNRLQTGFLGTEVIMHTLSKVGRTDVAYKLLLQHDNPSWLYSVDQGATTIWERWNSYTLASGFGDVGMNSFNHYSYGSVAGWMFRTMAGIGYDVENPGFKHVILAPNPDPILPVVKASYDSAYGMIVSQSVIDGGVWTYEAVLPANTTGTIKLPVEKIDSLTVNGKAPAELTLDADGIVYKGYENGIALFDAVAGSFKFVSGVTEYSYLTVTVGSDESIAPSATVSVNGGNPQKLPATIKAAAGDKITLTGAAVNDVDYAVAGWTDADGKSLAEGVDLSYTVGGDAAVTLKVKRISSENLAVGAKVTSNSSISNTDWNGKYLTDGIYTSVSGSLGFTSNSTNTDKVSHWVEIDLGKNAEFNRVQLYPRSDFFAGNGTTASFPLDFEIQVRGDGESEYTTAASFTGFDKPYGKPAVIEFTAVNARYVRLVVSRVGDAPAGEPYYLQLAEMGVYNTKG